MSSHPNITPRSDEREAARQRRELTSEKPKTDNRPVNVYAALLVSDDSDDNVKTSDERPKTPSPRAAATTTPPGAPVKKSFKKPISWADAVDSDEEEE
jgi:hypothetical protein